MLLCFPASLSITRKHTLVRRNWSRCVLVTTRAVAFVFFRLLNWQVIPLPFHWLEAVVRAVLENEIAHLSKSNASHTPFLSWIHTQKRTPTGTHDIETAAQPAASLLSFPPLSPWRQASRAGWFQTIVNQHRLKGGGGVSLCVSTWLKEHERLSVVFTPRWLKRPTVPAGTREKEYPDIDVCIFTPLQLQPSHSFIARGHRSDKVVILPSVHFHPMKGIHPNNVIKCNRYMMTGM